MKKILSVIMLSVFALPVFGACGGPAEKEEPPVLIEEEFDITNSGHINWYGRVWYDEENEYMLFNNTVRQENRQSSIRIYLQGWLIK